MAVNNSQPLQRQRFLILGTLLVLTALAWALLLWQAFTMHVQAMSLTMGTSAGLFIALWVVMMIAMMFPSAAPMIIMFAKISAGKKEQGQSFVPTWIFVSAYLLIWTLFGVLAYPLATGIQRLAEQSMWLMTHASRIAGVLLLVAGLYQLSPLKRVCLSKCRTPLQFLMTSWRNGYEGAFRMGLLHGAYCLGCCWLLFVILFPLGIMNIAVMALVAVLIYLEKSISTGWRVSQIAGGALIAYGVLVIIMPVALPSMM